MHQQALSLRSTCHFACSSCRMQIQSRSNVADCNRCVFHQPVLCLLQTPDIPASASPARFQEAVSLSQKYSDRNSPSTKASTAIRVTLFDLFRTGKLRCPLMSIRSILHSRPPPWPLHCASAPTSLMLSKNVQQL